MKKISYVLWGLVLIAVGTIFALNALNITDIELFFDGWWTLFLLVPCTIGLFTEQEKTGNLIGIVIGMALLLCAQHVWEWGMVWKLLLPAIIVIIGIRLLWGGLFGGKAATLMSEWKNNGKTPMNVCATFSSNHVDGGDEVFNGAELTAVFGSVQCNCQESIVEQDCAIKVSAVFGGIEIVVPDTVNVQVNVDSLFGGVSNKTKNRHENTVTVYVSGHCLFGGVEIK